MAPHHKDKKYQLCRAQRFLTQMPKKHAASVSHTMNANISLLKLTDNKSYVGGEHAKTNDHDKSEITPRVDRAARRARIPRDIVSADWQLGWHSSQ